VKLQDRDYELLSWLVQMKFMLLDQITSVFFKSCNPNRAPYRRMLKLMKAGLVETKRVYIESSDLYVPAKKAAGLLMKQGVPYSLGISKDKEFAHYKHDKALIDLRILFRELGIGAWIPERVVRSIKPRGSSPDALLVTKRYAYAIEYERTEKKLTRYKEIFERYESRDNYDAVLYICFNEAFISKIKKEYYPSRKFYFITLERLLKDRENATFLSVSDGLPVSHLVAESADCDFKDIPRDYLEYITLPRKDQTVQARKPFISICKPSEENYVDHWDSEEDSLAGDPSAVIGADTISKGDQEHPE